MFTSQRLTWLWAPGAQSHSAFCHQCGIQPAREGSRTSSRFDHARGRSWPDGNKNIFNFSHHASRSLTDAETRLLLRRIRRGNACNRALITAQLFLGFRISEILSLTIGHVCIGGQVRDRVPLPPRFTRAGYRATRTAAIDLELRRALEHYLSLRSRGEELHAREYLVDPKDKRLSFESHGGVVKDP